MLFNSFTFIIFFLSVTVLYYLLPHKKRWILLLISSYIFYMAWKPVFIVLIIISTLTNFIISLKIYNSKTKKRKKNLLLLSLFINFGLLFIFKYSVFINDSFMAVYKYIAAFLFEASGQATPVAWEMAEKLLGNYPLKDYSILLPMGISFYTFQAAAYTIDVYRGNLKPVRHYGIFSLYITFFPQLVAGPIERSKNLMPQFFRKHYFNSERVLYGLKIMLYGFFKKIVIADRVAIAVNTIYNNPESYSGLYLIIATVLFAFQIYCDFSGYSDIAVGSAKVLGYELMENFQNPYLSKSIKEFWRRWHISLSSWFTDYVYIPLGGNRVTKVRHYFNLLATFLISGMWHGANWTFLFWGGLHGIYLVVGNITYEFRQNLKQRFHIEKNIICRFISICITFSLVCFAWIFFRANSISDAFYIISNLLNNFHLFTTKQYLYEVITGLGISLYELKIIVSAILVLFVCEVFSGKKMVYEKAESLPYIFRLAFYVLIATFVLTAGVYYEAGQFIYFQF